MASNILNFFIEKSLSDFFEFDSKKIKTSIFDGLIEMTDLKFKKDIFRNFNMPRIELVNGQIGRLYIRLKMPAFYNYPISIKVEKLFIHAKQQNIDELQKEEVIKLLEEYKIKQLLDDEEFNQKLSELDIETPGITENIINNLQINITDVFFLYEDSVSYKRIPYTFGITLNKVNVFTTKNDYIKPNKIEQIISYCDINYKLIEVSDFSFFFDCFNSKDEIPYKPPKSKDTQEINGKNYLNQTKKFVPYCLWELHENCGKDAHQYVLYKLKLKINLELNNDYFKNHNPKYSASIQVKSVDMQVTTKQIEATLKVLAYLNLNDLYENEISKEHYSEKITDEEKEIYIRDYMIYYMNKYQEGDKDIKFPENIKNMDEKLSYDYIKKLRSKVYEKIYCSTSLFKLKNRIIEEENRWVDRDQKLINTLNNELQKLILYKKKIEAQEKNENKNNENNIDNFNNDDKTQLKLELPDDYVCYYFSIDIEEINLTVYEYCTKTYYGSWAFPKYIIKFEFDKLKLDIEIYQEGSKYKSSLDNCILSQEIIDNPKYKKIIFGKEGKNEDKILFIEYEINPRLKNSDYKFEMQSKRRLYIIYNAYITQYIQCKVIDIFSTTINFEDIRAYAKKSISRYIEEGYKENNLNNHFNVDMKINLISPIILFPLNIFDKKNKANILLQSGSLEITTTLPPRQNKKIDYTKFNKMDEMYDIYIIKFLGSKMSTITNLTEDDPLSIKEEIDIVENFDLKINCAILIENKNQNFDNLICEMIIPTIVIKLNEFQILNLIDYLENYYTESNDILVIIEKDKKIKSEKVKEDEIYSRISSTHENNSKDEGTILRFTESSDNSKILDNNNLDVIKEEEDEFKNLKNDEKEKEKEKKEEKKEERKKTESSHVPTIKIEDSKEAFEDREKQNNRSGAFILDNIKRIENSKKSMTFKIKINDINLILQKIRVSPDNKIIPQDYLIYQQNLFEMEYLFMDNGDMVIKLMIDNINLFDKDMDEKNQYCIDKNYQCIIDTNKNQENGQKNLNSFIDIKYLYIKSVEEMDTYVNMNDLNIVLSYDSMLRFYQFYNYYMDKYYMMMFLVDRKNPKNKLNTSFENRKKRSSKIKSTDQSKKITFNQIFNTSLQRSSERRITSVTPNSNIFQSVSKFSKRFKKKDKTVFHKKDDVTASIDLLAKSRQKKTRISTILPHLNFKILRTSKKDKTIRAKSSPLTTESNPIPSSPKVRRTRTYKTIKGVVDKMNILKIEPQIKESKEKDTEVEKDSNKKNNKKPDKKLSRNNIVYTRVQFWEKKLNCKEKINEETLRKSMKIVVFMKNTYLKLPLNPKKPKTAIFSLNFNIMSCQEFEEKFTNIYKISNKAKNILETIYQIKNSKTNISLSKVDFDLIHYLPDKQIYTRNIATKRILSNFRVIFKVCSYILPNQEHSIILTDIKTEPLLCNFGLKQFSKVVKLYNRTMKFYFTDLYEQYIPFVNSFFVRDGELIINWNKKKLTFYDCIKKVILSNKIKKSFKIEMKNLKKKKGQSKKLVNLKKFNEYLEFNVNCGRMCFIFFDNTKNQKILLLEININDLVYKHISNSNIKDTKNMEKELLGILTLTDVPHKMYNSSKLALFKEICFTFQINYFNFIMNVFEPLFDRIKIEIIATQVERIMRTKYSININEIIDFNISSYVLKVCNQFLIWYNKNEEREKQKKNKNKIIIPNVNISKKFNAVPNLPNTTKNEEEIKKKAKEEIILQFINLTYLDLKFFFETNPKNKINLKKNETKSFTKTDLFKARGLNKYKQIINTQYFNVTIMNQITIHRISFSRNNSRQYKIKLKKGPKFYNVYMQIKVITTDLIKKIYFSPSISICNHTIYDNIEIKINNPEIQEPDNIIILPKNQNKYIPLTWFLSDSLNSTILMKYGPYSEYKIIYDNVNQMIVDVYDSEKINENNLKKDNIRKKYKNEGGPGVKNIINSLIDEYDNYKSSQLVTFINNNQNINFCIDFYIYQSSAIKKFLELKNGNNMTKEEDETMTINSEDYEYFYGYLLFIRPCVTFINQIPFDLSFSVNYSPEKKILSLEKEYLYNLKYKDYMNQILLTIDYNEKKYKSKYFQLPKKNGIIKFYYKSNKNDNSEIICHVYRKPKEIDLSSELNFINEIIGYSAFSYEYIFCFDYLIVNRLKSNLFFMPGSKKKLKSIIRNSKKIFCWNIDNKNLDNEVFQLQPEKISLYSFPSFQSSKKKFIIKDELSKWSSPFNINTVLVNGVIKLEKKNSCVDIACIISPGKFYNNSVILIFEQKYIIYNDLGFDIYYKQENNKNCTDYLLQNDCNHEIEYINNTKNFRLGLMDSETRKINYSNFFDLDTIKSFDLLIPININDFQEKYDQNIFHNNDKDYYFLVRVIIQTYDQGLINIVLTKTYFPYLQIDNYTEQAIKIYENKNSNNFWVIDKKIKSFPFVFENNSEEKSTLYFEIYGLQKSFSFAKYEEQTFDIPNINKTIYFIVNSKDKKQTRCIKIYEIEKQKEETKKEKIIDKIMFNKKRKPTANSYNIYIKGICFSIINNALIELFYISFYILNIKYRENVIQVKNVKNRTVNERTETTENLELFLYNFQIDYCLNNSFRNIIVPKKQILPANEEKLLSSKDLPIPFLSFLCTRQHIKNFKGLEESVKYLQNDLIIQEFDLKIDQFALNNFSFIINEFLEELNYKENIDDKKSSIINESLRTTTNIDLKKLKRENDDKNKLLINYLFLSSIIFNITIRLDLSNLYTSGFPKIISRILGSIGNSIARITDSPLKFTEKGFENLYISFNEILNKLYNEYKNQLLKQLYKILGSSDLIGNPVKLIDNIGTGFYELINEPRKGFMQGPREFGIGVAKGIGSLISGVVGGAFGAVERISGTLYTSTQAFMGKNHENVIEENEEDNLAIGAVKGIYGGIKEIVFGFTGIFTNPFRGAKKNGVKGFFKGLGKGFIVLIISVLAAVFKIVYDISSSTKYTLNLLSGKNLLKTKRFRHPRVVLGEESISCYEKAKAEAKEAIWRILKIEVHNVNYAEYFYCADEGFDEKMSLVAVTNMYLNVIYDGKKIIFKLRLKEVRSCSLHFIDNKYILCFDMKKANIVENRKGFMLKKEYSNVACELYDLCKFLFENKYKRPDLLQEQQTNIWENSLEISDDKKKEVNSKIVKDEHNKKINIKGSSYSSSIGETLINNNSVMSKSLMIEHNENILEEKDPKYYINKTKVVYTFLNPNNNNGSVTTNDNLASSKEGLMKNDIIDKTNKS